MKTLALCALVNFAFSSLVSGAEGDSGHSLPPPVSEKVYSFLEIDTQKFELKDKIVRLEIGSLLGTTGSDPQGDGTVRYLAKDTSTSGKPYGQVAFSPEGLRKTGLTDNPKKGPVTLYVQVHLFPDKKAAAMSIAVGTHVSVVDGKANYSW